MSRWGTHFSTSAKLDTRFGFKWEEGGSRLRRRRRLILWVTGSRTAVSAYERARGACMYDIYSRWGREFNKWPNVQIKTQWISVRRSNETYEHFPNVINVWSLMRSRPPTCDGRTGRSLAEIGIGSLFRLEITIHAYMEGDFGVVTHSGFESLQFPKGMLHILRLPIFLDSSDCYIFSRGASRLTVPWDDVCLTSRTSGTPCALLTVKSNKASPSWSVTIWAEIGGKDWENCAS